MPISLYHEDRRRGRRPIYRAIWHIELWYYRGFGRVSIQKEISWVERFCPEEGFIKVRLSQLTTH